jgi:polyhydroxybutyrate depolymerase
MLATFAFLAIMAATEPLKPGDHTFSIDVDKRKRDYLVHVPPRYDGSKSYPVVLALHGGTSNAAQMARFSGLSDKADQAGFIVVYPDGVGTTFNAGNCCGPAMRQKVDDVAFVRALLDDLGKNVQVDPKRVYATGMSNGAMMSYLLASELSDRIAAIAPVAGPMGTDKCNPKRPVPVLHFHGTDDDHAPFKGGNGAKSLSKTNFYSVDHSIQAWVKANGCKAEPVVEKLPAKGDKDDATSVVRKTYGGGKDGSEVVLYVIDGGGHTWPGKKPPKLIDLGKSTTHISASDLMWEFFQKHPMK